MRRELCPEVIVHAYSAVIKQIVVIVCDSLLEELPRFISKIKG